MRESVTVLTVFSGTKLTNPILTEKERSRSPKIQGVHVSHYDFGKPSLSNSISRLTLYLYQHGHVPLCTSVHLLILLNNLEK